jgi:hypothetical protein
MTCIFIYFLVLENRINKESFRHKKYFPRFDGCMHDLIDIVNLFLF